MTTQPLSEVEETVYQALINKDFSVPEPIFLALKAIGKVKLATGEIIRPTFPELPHKKVENIPGTLGVVDKENHSIYEDLPVIGPTVEALLQRVATKDHKVYASKLVPTGTTASINLQGFAKLNPCKNEIIATLMDLDIEPDGTFQSVKDTGINYKILDFVSEYLQSTEIFKLYSVNPLTIPETGSVGQIVQARPDVDELTTHTTAGNVYVSMEAMTAESAVSAAVSEVFGLSQWKENCKPPTTELWLRVNPWSCIVFAKEDEMIKAFEENRNLRRNLPKRYFDRVFYAAGDQTGDYRRQMVDRLVHS